MTAIMIPELSEVSSIEYPAIQNALAGCERRGYQPLYMPELADVRIATDYDQCSIRLTWGIPFISLSSCITGRSKAGHKVVVYAHIPTYLCDSDNLKEGQKTVFVKGNGIVGAVTVPPDEFYRLLDLEDNKDVFVVDYKTLSKAHSDAIRASEALKHPQTIPFFGGRDRAEAYLAKHAQVCKDDQLNRGFIEILFSRAIADVPLGHLLAIGSSYYYDHDEFIGPLVGDLNMEYIHEASFIVKPETLENKIQTE